jgi:glycosyltransferase involved in cell wall biosynthesis
VKVLQVNKFLHTVGGTETVMFQTADLLRAHGHQVSFFAMQDERNLATEDQTYFVSNVDYGPETSGGMLERLRLPHIAGRFFYSPEAADNMDDLVRDLRPDVAHLHNIYHQLSPSLLRPLKQRRIPVVMTLHDYKLICPNYTLFSNGAICERCKGHRYYEAVLQACVRGSRVASALCATEAYAHRFTRAYSGVDTYIAPSRFMRDKLVEFGMHPALIAYLPNFLNLEDYAPCYEAGGYFVYAGRLERVKGIGTLLEAMRSNGSEAALELKVAGDGEQRAELEQEARSHRLRNVSFLGRLPRDDLGRLIQGAAFVVVPSQWYENAPMSVLEAFAYGKPVIGTRIGGIPELIEDGMTGLLVEPGDAGGLRRAIDRLASNPALAIEMGRNARRYVEQNHGPQQHYERLLAIYEAAGASSDRKPALTGGAT